MRYFMTVLLLFFIGFTSLIDTAEAARFGGGRSFGMQRSMSGFSRIQKPASAAKAFQPNATSNRWFAPLAGLLGGGLLAYLFMGHGIGSGILSWLAIIAVFLFIMSFIRNRFQLSAPRMQANQFSATHAEPFGSPSSQAMHYPLGFNPDSFLREAKVKFIRLQAAYDAHNLQDLREFTSPEVFAEVQLQLQERGEVHNVTDVVSLDAELLDVATDAQSTVVSVKFSGMLKENSQQATAFSEVWHFQQASTSDHWMVVGVQQ